MTDEHGASVGIPISMVDEELKTPSEVDWISAWRQRDLQADINLRIEDLAPSTSSAQDSAEALSEAPAFALTNLGACELPEAESPPPSVT